MATRRRPSEPREPTPRGWAIARRLVLPTAANDNRLPPGLRALRIVALAAALAACAWIVAEML
jgi:hypothetical protein